MNADAGRRLVEQPLDVVELALERFHRRQARAQLDVRARPRCHHSLGLMPLPMNRNASRFGVAAAATGSAPHTDTDSSHGSAITTPVPRRKRRREISCELRWYGLGITLIVSSSVSWALRVWS